MHFPRGEAGWGFCDNLFPSRTLGAFLACRAG